MTARWSLSDPVLVHARRRAGFPFFLSASSVFSVVYCFAVLLTTEHAEDTEQEGRPVTCVGFVVRLIKPNLLSHETHEQTRGLGKLLKIIVDKTYSRREHH